MRRQRAPSNLPNYMARNRTPSGTFLVPGASKNRRKYTTENIGNAVTRMNTRLKSGQTIPMHTSHAKNAEGDTLATAAMVTKVWQDPKTGAGRFEYQPLNTTAGKEVESMRKEGALKTVSIFGSWVGEPRMEDGFETADDLDVVAVDFTHRPGVGGAQLDESAVTAELALSGATIWESFDEAFVDETISEDEAERPSALAMLEAQTSHHFEDGFCRTCEADGTYIVDEASKQPYGDVTYADPGYQADKKKRYPLDTKAHVRSAWSYINVAKNAAKYTAAQVRSIKGKIKRAASKFGIDTAAEAEQLRALIETMGGEFADILEAYASSSLDNGQGYISVSAYTDEPADLPKVGAAVARAALAGLLKLDPDNDGDVDLGPSGDAPPGDGNGEENDDDMEQCPSCDADLPDEAMYCPNCGQPVPGAESTEEESKESNMFTTEQVKALISPERAATLEASKTEYTAEELQVLMAPVAKEEVKPEATTEESELAKARRLVAEDDARQAEKPITVGQMQEMLKAEREATIKEMEEKLVESARTKGTVTRKGLAAKAQALSEAEGIVDDPKELAQLSPEDFRANFGAAFEPLMPQG